MRATTLVFLLKQNEESLPSDICLAMKKRGFGTGKLNGIGGKVEDGETIEQAAIRETQEEIGVHCLSLQKTGELAFTYAHKPEWDQLVHVYICTSWTGEPIESEEMKPDWFKVESIPFDRMWADDPFWLPLVLKGDFVDASFTFDGDTILKQQVSTRLV